MHNLSNSIMEYYLNKRVFFSIDVMLSFNIFTKDPFNVLIYNLQSASTEQDQSAKILKQNSYYPFAAVDWVSIL